MRIKPSITIVVQGNPYLERWHLFRIGKLPRVYLHHFLASDDDRALHNHPWWFISILLRGSYIEHTRSGSIRRRAGSVVYRGLSHDHRISLIPGEPSVWTLFITGPEVRNWGFWCVDHDYQTGEDVGEYFVPASEFDGCN